MKNTNIKQEVSRFIDKHGNKLTYSIIGFIIVVILINAFSGGTTRVSTLQENNIKILQQQIPILEEMVRIGIEKEKLTKRFSTLSTNLDKLKKQFITTDKIYSISKSENGKK